MKISTFHIFYFLFIFNLFIYYYYFFYPKKAQSSKLLFSFSCLVAFISTLQWSLSVPNGLGEGWGGNPHCATRVTDLNAVEGGGGGGGDWVDAWVGLEVKRVEQTGKCRRFLGPDHAPLCVTRAPPPGFPRARSLRPLRGPTVRSIQKLTF